MSKRQYTLRGIEPALDRAVRETGKRYGVSLNSAALALLKKGAGLGDDREVRFAGFRFKKWSTPAVNQIKGHLTRGRKIDPGMWH